MFRTSSYINQEGDKYEYHKENQANNIICALVKQAKDVFSFLNQLNECFETISLCVSKNPAHRPKPSLLKLNNRELRVSLYFS